jgi:hypothetical protein
MPRVASLEKMPSAITEPLAKLGIRKPAVDRQRTENLEKFVKRHGAKSAAALQAESAKMRALIARTEEKKKNPPRWVLTPGKSAFLAFWDFPSSVALLYTLSISPFEAGFVETTVGAAAWRDPYFIANRVIDLIFLFDMILQFFIAVENQNLDIAGETLWVTSPRKIAKRYLMSWFLLDAATLFLPAYFDISTATDGVGEDAPDPSALRALRVVRLTKLVRLVRASRIYKRLLSKITLSSAQLTVLTCVTLLLVGAHLYASILGICTAMHSNKQDTWLGDAKYGYCKDDACQVSTPTLYLASFMWAVMIITGTGGTDFYPSESSEAETMLVLVLMLVGALLWTYLLALFCDMATNGEPGMTHFKQLLDSLNRHANAHQLPKEMARRIREYMYQQQPSQLSKYNEGVISCLSAGLQCEILLYVNRPWLQKVWFFQNLEPACLARLTREMSALTFAPSEIAPLQNLYVVCRGMVLYGSLILRSGAVWGDDVILTEPRYFSKRHARAISYVDTMMLNRDTLTQVIVLFPASKARLRLMMIKLALRRHIVEAARCQCTNAGDLFKHAAPGGTDGISFFSRLDKDRDMAKRQDAIIGTPKSKRQQKRWDKQKAWLTEKKRDEEAFDGTRTTVLMANQIPQTQWRDAGDAPLEDDKHACIMFAMDELSQKLISMQKQHSVDMERLYRHLKGLVGGAGAAAGLQALPTGGEARRTQAQGGSPYNPSKSPSAQRWVCPDGMDKPSQVLWDDRPALGPSSKYSGTDKDRFPDSGPPTPRMGSGPPRRATSGFEQKRLGSPDLSGKSKSESFDRPLAKRVPVAAIATTGTGSNGGAVVAPLGRSQSVESTASLANHVQSAQRAWLQRFGRPPGSPRNDIVTDMRI